MPDLKTSYMGIILKNPIIVSSSGLTLSLGGLKKCEDAGAGAVVLKSIFEEQFIIDADIQADSYSMFPEAVDYMRSGGMMEYAPQKMCAMIEEAKKQISIPIIASINCQTDKLWPSFARQVQNAGADALELNISMLPFELKKTGDEYEKSHMRILKEIRKEVSIPVSIKLIPEITALPNLVWRLCEANCNAVVLFNWFLESDINIKTLKTRNVKGEGNLFHSLRWVALLSGRVDCDIASSGGVKNAEDLIKQILAGASAVQICSLFYKKGLQEISNLIKGLEDWMAEKKYMFLDDFRGELSFKKQELSFNDLGEASAFFRKQYLKTYS